MMAGKDGREEGGRGGYSHKQAGIVQETQGHCLRGMAKGGGKERVRKSPMDKHMYNRDEITAAPAGPVSAEPSSAVAVYRSTHIQVGWIQSDGVVPSRHRL